MHGEKKGTGVRLQPPLVIAVADFFTTEIWTARGLVTHDTLFAIDHATRAVEILGTTTNPTADFMKQIARNVADSASGFLRAKRYLIIDRDSLYCDAFKSILRAAGVTPVRIPASSPNCNSIAERFVLSIKSECLSRFVFFGIDSLRRATAEFVAHYLSERNHQGLGNQLIAPTSRVGSVIGRVRKKERLGGLLNFYHRAA
jgi:putative transposase